MESEEGQIEVFQNLELLIEMHVQDRIPYVLADLEEKAKVNCTEQKTFQTLVLNLFAT